VKYDCISIHGAPPRARLLIGEWRGKLQQWVRRPRRVGKTSLAASHVTRLRHALSIDRCLNQSLWNVQCVVKQIYAKFYLQCIWNFWTADTLRFLRRLNQLCISRCQSD